MELILLLNNIECCEREKMQSPVLLGSVDYTHERSFHEKREAHYC